MARPGRFTQFIFGSTAGTNEIAEFGSFAAAAPARYSGTTITPAIVQTLSNYLQGWFGAVDGENAPAIEDMNALCYLFAFQLFYNFTLGVAEWDSATEYYVGSIVQDGLGNLFTSLTNSNTGNALTSATNWIADGNTFITTAVGATLTPANNIVRSDTTLSSQNIILPAVATCIGKKFTIKDVGTGGFQTFVYAQVGETVDGSRPYSTPLNGLDSMTVFNNGVSWDVI